MVWPSLHLITLWTFDCRRQDSSSFQTFKCCLEVLQNIQCDFFVLENVDLEESENSDGANNLELILKGLDDAGYQTKCYKLISSDFSVPQRRVRLYFLGFHRTKQPQVTFDMVDQNLELFRSTPLHPDIQIQFD